MLDYALCFFNHSFSKLNVTCCWFIKGACNDLLSFGVSNFYGCCFVEQEIKQCWARFGNQRNMAGITHMIEAETQIVPESPEVYTDDFLEPAQSIWIFQHLRHLAEENKPWNPRSLLVVWSSAWVAAFLGSTWQHPKFYISEPSKFKSSNIFRFRTLWRN